MKEIGTFGEDLPDLLPELGLLSRRREIDEASPVEDRESVRAQSRIKQTTDIGFDQQDRDATSVI